MLQQTMHYGQIVVLICTAKIAESADGIAHLVQSHFCLGRATNWNPASPRRVDGSVHHELHDHLL